MFVKQISVFLENAKGALSKMTRLLADAGLDLIAMSIADTEHYGILRCIVSDTDKGIQVLRENGYTVRLTDVLAVCVPDEPGGLAKVLESLSREEIQVEYVYSFVRSSGNYALVIFHLSDPEKGLKVLVDGGVKMLAQEQIRVL
ncbi:MAG: hypothetical protein RSJ41_00710 [Clostridia bacterium]